MSPIFSAIKKNRGVTLVEMILYVVLLTFVMSVIVQMLISVSGVYKNIKLTRELESSGTIAMESMLREIRNASGVDIGRSLIGSSPGAITVAGVDNDLNPYEMTFSVNSGVLQISKDGGAGEAITSSPISVSYLLFTHLTNANTEGVRVELEVSGTSGGVSKSKMFYGFAVLRGSY